ncbi:MAG: electron transport complex subunit RsxG [Candidatus Thiodiazotropha sp. (ex Epidulcina cf. delphinae)]|nr:electron transport complex subunit RsxG [Candidatus Thiodiazotropha sp. (ex Epidulcina cf. delphinae)]
MNSRLSILIAAGILATFAILGASLVAFTHSATKERIAANERETLLRSLRALVPPDTVDNDMVSDVIVVQAPEWLGSERTRVYRGRKMQQPVAAVLTSIVPNGYSGPIKLLVAVRYDGTLAGVRVISHKETPGLGDKMEASRSDWIYGFNDQSLGDPPLEKWHVKRDGGEFDQFTGATVTPRSIVKAVKNTLLYVQEHKEALYDRQATPPATATQG